MTSPLQYQRMAKNIYETTGSFQLVDGRHQRVPHNRPAVLAESHFTQRFVATRQLRVVAAVNDEATDEEFAKYWAEAKGDRDLAIESFKSSFAVEPPPPKPERKTKPKEE